MTGVGNAVGTGVRRGSPVCGEDRDLANRLVGIRRDERGERLLGRLPGLEQLEAERAVAPLGVRLRRDDADPRSRPEDAGAAGERARLDGGAELPRLRMAGDDRVGQGDCCARIFALYSRFSAW